MMHSQSLTSLLPLLALLSLLLQPVVSTYTLYERREEQLQSRRLAYAQDNYDPNFALGPAHQARDEDDLLMRLYRREASNAEFYKKQGIIKDTPPNNGKRCKGSICTKEEMKKIIAEDTRKCVIAPAHPSHIADMLSVWEISAGNSTTANVLAISNTESLV